MNEKFRYEENVRRQINDEPIDIEVHSRDSFQAQKNVKVQVEVHEPPKIIKKPFTRISENIKKSPPAIQKDADTIEVLEENIPLNKQELKAMDVDTDEELIYRRASNLMKYREPKTPNTSEDEMEKIFSPPAYKARTKPMKINRNEKAETKGFIYKKSFKQKSPKKQERPYKKLIREDKVLERRAPVPKVTEIQEIPINLLESRDHIWMRNDNVIYFIDTKGNPIDEVGKELIARKICKKPNNFKGILGNILSTGTTHRRIFGIIIKEETTNIINERNISKEFQELKNEMLRLRVSRASISQSMSDINVPWFKLRKIIRLTFMGTHVQITICNSQVRVPEPRDRLRIISECHSSSVGGHKGIAKTLARIRNKYFWKNMKAQVEKFVQTCGNCQKKKLVRIKTKQPMIITARRSMHLIK